MHGPHPKDRALFAEEKEAVLRAAAGDLRWLLGRGYALPGALALVGNRFQLAKRQRQCLLRGVCAPDLAEAVRRAAVEASALRGAALLIDGHNVLIAVETALARGVLIRSDDGFLRDLAERHGSYRKSARTEEALLLLRDALASLALGEARCYLDRPLPLSGLLARRVREVVPAAEVAVVPSPDGAIAARLKEDPRAVCATSDAGILRRAARVFDLAAYIARARIPDAWTIAL